jgi:hypothetical protein
MIWIVDDFYPNPDEIRKRALMLDYTRGKSTNKARVTHIMHPGHRNNPKREFWWENRIYLRNRWKDIAGVQVLDFESMKSSCAFNMGFAEKENTFNWVHSDSGWGPGPRMYACVLYLTPNPPSNTGTLLFEHKGSIFDEQEKKKDKKRYHPQFYGDYWKDPISTNPAWKLHCKVENRYNRLVMYDARMLHAPENAGFGNTKETARLTQIGFWYGEDRVQI